MTKRSLTALVVLNAVLLAALVVTTTSPTPAHGQAFGGRANYTMISGAVTGRGSQDAIYVIDLASGAIIPMFYNGSSNEFEIFRGTIVSRDVGGAAGRNRR